MASIPSGASGAANTQPRAFHRAAIRAIFAGKGFSMRRTFAPVLLAAASLSGCAESQLAGHLLYMTPYKIEDLDCTALKGRAASATAQVKKFEDLRDKANASTAGPVINSMVYGPDYTRARWEQRLYQGEIARKNCDAPPPEAAAEAAKPAN